MSLHLLIRAQDLRARGRSGPKGDGHRGGGADDVLRGAGRQSPDAAKNGRSGDEERSVELVGRVEEGSVHCASGTRLLIASNTTA
jgi:hypothetical protein